MMATEGPFLTPPAITGPVQMPAAVRRGGQAGPRETPALTPIFRSGGLPSIIRCLAHILVVCKRLKGQVAPCQELQVLHTCCRPEKAATS